MEHIQDIYKKNPEQIKELLLLDNIKVNLKVDGKPFQVLYNDETDELEFHGRSGNETTVGPLITDFDRYFSKYLNDAIAHIEKHPAIFKKYKFMTIEIIDNELLLTSVIKKNGDFVNSASEIRRIANELDTEVMPTLWEGKFNQRQQYALLDIIESGEVPTKKEFINLVKSLFSNYKDFPKKLIMANTEFIEGIVFFFDKGGKIIEYKLVDPAFRAQSAGYKSSSKEEKSKNQEYYNKLYEFFLDWVEKNGEKMADNRIHSIEKNFLKMMSDSKNYNKIMNLGANIRINDIARYGVQLDRTTPELAKEIRKKGNLYKTIYEIFFNLFKKPKKRNYTINKEFQMKVNDAITLFEGMEGYENYANDLLEEELMYDNNIILEAYTITFDNEEDDKKEFIKRLNTDNKDILNSVNKLFDLVYSYNNDENYKNPFRYDNKSNKIKLRNNFEKNKDFLNTLSKIDLISNINTNGFKIGTKTIDFGDGSLGKGGKSAVNTESQENAFKEAINNHNKKGINDIIKDYNLDNTYEFSVQAQINKLNKFLDNKINEYSCIRPSNDSDNELMKSLNALYKIKKIFNNSPTNYITPADVYVYKTNKKEEIINTINNFIDTTSKDIDNDTLFNECKSMFMKFLNDKLLIGVSLKKITKSSENNPIETLNVDNTLDIEFNTKFDMYLTERGLVSFFNIKLNNEPHRIKFNYRSTHNKLEPLSFEFNTTGSGGADGKFKQFVQEYVKSGDIKYEIIDKKEFEQNYKNYNAKQLEDFYNENYTNLLSKFEYFRDPNYDEETFKELENNIVNKFIFITTLSFANYLFSLYNKDNKHKVFFDFIEDCYLSSKKVTKRSLPYIKIY